MNCCCITAPLKSSPEKQWRGKTSKWAEFGGKKMGRVWGSIPCCTLCAEREIILGKDKRKFMNISSFLACWSTAWMEKAWKIENEKVWGTCMWMELRKRKVWRLLYYMWMATESTHNRKSTNSQVVRMTQPGEMRQLTSLATLVLAQWVHEQSCYDNKDGGSGRMGLLKSMSSYLPGLI